MSFDSYNKKSSESVLRNCRFLSWWWVWFWNTWLGQTQKRYKSLWTLPKKINVVLENSSVASGKKSTLLLSCRSVVLALESAFNYSEMIAYELWSLLEAPHSVCSQTTREFNVSQTCVCELSMLSVQQLYVDWKMVFLFFADGWWHPICEQKFHTSLTS